MYKRVASWLSLTSKKTAVACFRKESIHEN